MREIKFRAWDKDRKVMIPYVSILGIDEGFITTFTRGWIHNSMDWDQEDGYCDNFELMQLTGLYDKNGKEIYEGDIGIRNISITGVSEPYIFSDYWLIEWLDKTAGFTTTRIGEKNRNGYKKITPKRNSFSTRFSEIEIIGNIHQNPELV